MNLVGVSPQGLHARSGMDVPELARPVNGPRDAVVASEVELRTRDLPLVSSERVNTPMFSLTFTLTFGKL